MAMDFGADNPLWAMLMGAGAGVGGRPDAPIGGALQGLMAGRQMHQEMATARDVSALRKMQIAAEQEKAEQRRRWNAMFGTPGINPDAPQPNQPQMASADPAVTAGALTPMPGERMGPTPDAARRMPAPPVNPIDTIPANLRPILGMLGPEQGAQFLAQNAVREQRPPAVQEFFDEQGRPYKAQFVNGRWERVGGAKTPDWQNPAYIEARKEIAAAGKPDMRQQMDIKQETEESKVVGKGFGEAFRDLQNADMQAPGKLAKLEKLNSLLDQVNTGKFAGTMLELKRTAKAAGMDLEAIGVRDDVAPAQAAQAMSREMALELRNPSGGAGMPGALSDKDREFLESMVPGIEMDPQGRRLIVDTRKKLIQRERDVAKLARDYRKRNGSLNEGFYDELAQFSDANPLFAGLEAPKAAAPAGGGPKVGAIEQGYRFKGGNPADPRSWEKVQ